MSKLISAWPGLLSAKLRKVSISSWKVRLIALICLTSSWGSAHAIVECAVTPTRYYIGDSILWVIWKEGGAGTVTQASPDFKPMLAAVITAVASGRPMVVRYADGVACNSQPGAMVGIWSSP